MTLTQQQFSYLEKVAIKKFTFTDGLVLLKYTVTEKGLQPSNEEISTNQKVCLLLKDNPKPLMFHFEKRTNFNTNEPYYYNTLVTNHESGKEVKADTDCKNVLLDNLYKGYAELNGVTDVKTKREGETITFSHNGKQITGKVNGLLTELFGVTFYSAKGAKGYAKYLLSE